ncbi:MAG: PadR family transcriptional regulator [Candidatus Acidiferrales bacterium]
MYQARYNEWGCGDRPHRRHFVGRHRFFGGFRSGFMGGPAMRAAKMLASGDLQLIILALLSEKPRHGYEIIKAIEEHSSGIYTPSPGMVYPALTYLEEMGFAASETEGTKKLYHITEAGAEHLKANRASVDETLDHLARFGRKVAEFQKRFNREHEEEEDAGCDPGRHIKDEWRQARVEFRKVRDDLKAALYDKLDASAEERRRIIGVLRRAIDEIRGE